MSASAAQGTLRRPLLDPGATAGLVALAQSLPNPTSGGATIAFSLPAPAQSVRLALYDIRGRRVKTLFDGALDAGPQTVSWDGLTDGGTRATAGIYFYKLVVQDSREEEALTPRLVLIR